MRQALLLGTSTGGREVRIRTVRAWRAAGDLAPGDTVILKSGRTATVKSVEGAPGLHTVHNFSVEDHHTYFVAQEGVLVHNRNTNYRTPSPLEIVRRRIAADVRAFEQRGSDGRRRILAVLAAFRGDAETIRGNDERAAELFGSDAELQAVYDVVARFYPEDPIGAMTNFMRRLDIAPPQRRDITMVVENRTSPMTSIDGIVIHRTSGSNYPNWDGLGLSPHFTVDQDGTIYVNLDLDRRGEHVGVPRQSLNADGTRTGSTYPSNRNTVGIEVVGAALSSGQVMNSRGNEILRTRWEDMSIRQKVSTRYLIERVGIDNGLNFNQVYAHEVISSKTPGEGLFVIDSIGLGHQVTDMERRWRNGDSGPTYIFERDSQGRYHSYGVWRPGQ